VNESTDKKIKNFYKLNVDYLNVIDNCKSDPDNFTKCLEQMIETADVSPGFFFSAWKQ